MSYNRKVRPPARRRTTILVVEDDPSVREWYRELLTPEGYEVALAADGLDALRQIEATVPSLVLLDLGLPLVGGRDVQQELAAHAATEHIPIIVVTGEEPDAVDASPYLAVFTKPVAADVLLRAIRRALRVRWR